MNRLHMTYITTGMYLGGEEAFTLHSIYTATFYRTIIINNNTIRVTPGNLPAKAWEVYY